METWPVLRPAFPPGWGGAQQWVLHPPASSGLGFALGVHPQLMTWLQNNTASHKTYQNKQIPSLLYTVLGFKIKTTAELMGSARLLTHVRTPRPWCSPLAGYFWAASSMKQPPLPWMGCQDNPHVPDFQEILCKSLLPLSSMAHVIEIPLFPQLASAWARPICWNMPGSAVAFFSAAGSLWS